MEFDSPDALLGRESRFKALYDTHEANYCFYKTFSLEHRFLCLHMGIWQFFTIGCGCLLRSFLFGLIFNSRSFRCVFAVIGAVIGRTKVLVESHMLTPRAILGVLVTPYS